MKLLLFNGNVSTVSKELREVIEEVQEDTPNHRESRIKEWRARGVVGRIHNIIVYIRGSNQRRNAFLLALEDDIRKEKGFMVRLDNDT